MASRRRPVEHLVSVIKPATLKALIESKQEMDKSELKKDSLEFVCYLKKMAIIHDEHCHVVHHKNTGDSGMKINGKRSDSGSRNSGNNSGGISHGGASNKASDREKTKSGRGRSSDATSTGKQSARELPTCLNTKDCAGKKHYLSDCPHTGKDENIVLLSEYKKKRDADWRLPDSGQRCRREQTCEQMMTLFSLAMLLTLKCYILFRTSKL
jgi:hypothetical protein